MSFNHLQLNAAIAKSGKTKSSIADEMGVHLNTVSNWSRGKATPTFDSFIELLLVLGWSEMEIRGSSLGQWYSVNGSRASTPAGE